MSPPTKTSVLHPVGAALVAVLLLAALLAGAAPASAASAVRGVYTTTNAADGNELVAYQRDRDGALTEVGRVATGGLGTGQGLGSQGAVVIARGWLFTVNAGSDSVSAFSLRGRMPQLVDVEPSGGERPVSVTAHGDLLYVLNGDGPGAVTGFRITAFGALEPLEGSARPLSGAATTDPAQVAFTADGRQLVVTEKATNRLTTFTVGPDGLLSAPMVTPSAGQTPFGFDVDRRGRLFVSEAFGGAADASAVSSYAAGVGGDLDVVSPSVPTTETAACWVVVTRNGRHLYTTNTGSGSVTGYRIALDGSLSRLDADGVTADTGAGSAPTDAALSADSRVLYVLHSGTGAVGAYAVGLRDGGLTPVGAPVGGLPASAAGLASG